MANNLKNQVVELIRRTSSSLPKDVIASIERATEREPEGSLAKRTFGLMLENVRRAREASAPICQDTGTLIFYVDHGPDFAPHEIEKAIVQAVRAATAKTYLRPNA